MIPAGRRAYVRVRVETRPPATPDGAGGAVENWTASGVPWSVGWDTGGGDERVVAGTVVAQTAITVTGPYRSDVTTRARLVHLETGAVLGISSVDRTDGRPWELVVRCTETEA